VENDSAAWRQLVSSFSSAADSTELSCYCLYLLFRQGEAPNLNFCFFNVIESTLRFFNVIFQDCNVRYLSSADFSGRFRLKGKPL